MSITAVPLKPVKRRVLVYLWAGVAVAAVGAAALAVQTPVDPAATFLAHNARNAGVKQTPSGLQYQVLTPGTGAPPTDQDVALVNYEGKFVDGTVFDKSQRPFPVPLGEHQVVPGFEEALSLIPKGGKYRVWIKPSLAYGDTARPGMPAHST
ncbi:MAG: FKBP-type peptidyl-prolyl cis-trans isomerase, partial [Sphingomonas sp.]